MEYIHVEEFKLIFQIRNLRVLYFQIIDGLTDHSCYTNQNVIKLNGFLECDFPVQQFCPLDLPVQQFCPFVWFQPKKQGKGVTQKNTIFWKTVKPMDTVIILNVSIKSLQVTISVWKLKNMT